MTSKPKNVTLTHPESDQKLEVAAGDEGIYLTQGWEPVDAKSD